MDIRDYPICIINLEKRTDRLEHVKKEMEKMKIVEYEIVKAVDGKLLTTLPKTMYPIHWDPPTYGLCLTFQGILERAIANNWPYFTLFEDDVYFRDEPCLRLPIKDFDIFYLGGSPNMRCPLRPIKYEDTPSKGIIRILQGLRGSQSVVFRRSIYERLLAKLKENTAIDYAMDLLQSECDAYAYYPFKTRQINGYSDILGRDRNLDKNYFHFYP
jgi:hypothetical protein